METQPPDVDDIIKRLRDGDRVAERHVYDRFISRVRSFLRRRLPDDEAVAETANDVLHAVIRAMRAGDVRDTDSLPAFVLGVARNLANNYLRANAGRHREQPLAPDLDVVASSDERLEAERLEVARNALDLLEEADRTVLILVLKGHAPAAISSLLGLTSEVVRARKSRAIKKLVAHLAAASEGHS